MGVRLALSARYRRDDRQLRVAPGLAGSVGMPMVASIRCSKLELGRTVVRSAGTCDVQAGRTRARRAPVDGDALGTAWRWLWRLRPG